MIDPEMGYSTDVAWIEGVIGKTAEEWKGNCYAVASACLERGVVEGSLRYGLYTGPVSPASMFHKEGGRPFFRHGWVALPGGMVWDPTRWVFEAARPYVFVGPAEDYDFAMAGLKRHLLGNRPCPEPKPGERELRLPDSPLLASMIVSLCGLDSEKVGVGQLFWLSNLSPGSMGGQARNFYRWLEKEGLLGFVPIDYQRSEMEC